MVEIPHHTGEQKVCRRSILNGAAGALTGISSISVSVIGSTGKDTTEIITHKSGDEPDVKKDVPTSWWEHELHVRKLRERLQSKYERSNSVTAVGIGSGDRIISDRQSSSIVVEVNSLTKGATYTNKY